MKIKIKKVALGKTEFVEKDLLKKPKMEKSMSNKIPKRIKTY